MEALILSCGTGGGHNAAGAAVCEALTRRGHHAWMLNPFTLKSEKLAGRIDNTYIKIAQRAPRLVAKDAGQVVAVLSTSWAICTAGCPGGLPYIF